MRTVSATELGRRAAAVLRWVEDGREAVVVTRLGRPVAHILPGPPAMTALEALGDLFGTLSNGAAEGWAEEARTAFPDTVGNVRESWDT